MKPIINSLLPNYREVCGTVTMGRTGLVRERDRRHVHIMAEVIMLEVAQPLSEQPEVEVPNARSEVLKSSALRSGESIIHRSLYPDSLLPFGINKC